MLKRIITSICAACLLIPTLIFSDTWIFPIAMSFVSVLCLFEAYRCINVYKNLAATLPAYVIGGALPLLTRFMADGGALDLIAIVAITVVIYVLYLFVIVVWSNGSFTYTDMSSLVFISVYITLALSFVIYIRDFSDIGQYLYMLIFIGAWVTDIFAYFIGVLFGRHKLIERVSPKKTIEGSIGGTVFCTIAFVSLGLIVENFFGRDANLIFLAISGAFVSLIAQIGDLIMSVVKRHYGIKDFGKIFPGHGGMLDRFDSILSVSLGVGVMCLISYVTGIPVL